MHLDHSLKYLVVIKLSKEIKAVSQHQGQPINVLERIGLLLARLVLHSKEVANVEWHLSLKEL